VQDALWSDRRIRLSYRRALDRVVERIVEPLGLVCKAGVWYLLAAVEGAPRVYRVSRIEDAEPTEETFERPPDFDLRATWAAAVVRFKVGSPGTVMVTLRVDPSVSGRFTRVAGDQIVRRTEGGAVLEMPAHEGALALLVAFGSSVEVLAPADLRARLADLGRGLTSMYDP
jgi:predicted DNA-binding transcriptional regulator YafY